MNGSSMPNEGSLKTPVRLDRYSLLRLGVVIVLDYVVARDVALLVCSQVSSYPPIHVFTVTKSIHIYTTDRQRFELSFLKSQEKSCNISVLFGTL